MATITKITRRRHENPPHGVATVKEWFNYVTAMRNEGNCVLSAGWPKMKLLKKYERKTVLDCVYLPIHDY